MAYVQDPTTGQLVWQDDTNTFGFGYQSQQQPQTNTYDYLYQQPAATDINLDFGIGSTQNQNPLAINSITTAQGNNGMNWASMNTGTDNINGTQTIYGQGGNQITAPGSSIATTGQYGTQQPGFFTDMSGLDWLNTGTGLASLGAGIYFGKQRVDQGQQALDLKEQQYADIKAEQQALDDAYASFG